MKKQLLISFFILFVALVGCTNENDVVGDPDESGQQEQKEEKDAEDTNIKEEESEAENEEEIKVEETSAFKYELNENTWFIEPLEEDINEKVVLLTIDDAPDKYTLDMAETLLELDANAIFFVNGHFLETEEAKETLKKIDEMGFMIGNHTYSHKSLPDLSEDEQKEEIVRVNQMVKEVTGEKPIFFRAPFGANTDYTRKVAEEEGMTLMNWSYGYDWNEDYMTKEAITDIMINADELGDGANLLMHDREWTAEGLVDIVKGLRDKGYEIVDPTTIQGINSN